ncbi:MAG: CoA transferase, partial [Acidimicrobiia bacterium]|nr:CoA transferase [Acidimicrobiia bacterium]
MREADVVVENFTPREMANFGLSYGVLRQVNERIVMIALSGFGASGPWKDFCAFAFPTEQVSGLTWLNGPAGGPPEAVGQIGQRPSLLMADDQLW